MMVMSEPPDWFACPVCGAEVRAGALSCKECGSDDKTGWSTETEYDGLDLPDPGEPVDYRRLGLEDPEYAARVSDYRRRTGRIVLVYLLVALAIVMSFLAWKFT